MLDAYPARRQQELHDQGAVASIAHHDPKQLRQLEPRAVGAPDGPVRDWFDAYVDDADERRN